MRAVKASLAKLAGVERLLREEIQELGDQFSSLCAALPQEPRTFDSLPSEVLTLVAESLAKKDTRLGKDKVWAELSLEEQAAVETLGSTEECWDHGWGTLGYTEEGVPIEGCGWLLPWAEMGAAETSAALTLGYDQSSWDYEQEADPSLVFDGLPILHPNGLYARAAAPLLPLLLQGHSSLANFAAASKTCLAAAHMELYGAKALRHSQLSEHARTREQLISDLKDQLIYFEQEGTDVSSFMDGLDALMADQALLTLSLALTGVVDWAHETGATGRMRVVLTTRPRSGPSWTVHVYPELSGPRSVLRFRNGQRHYG